jgi:hypothetical protein
MLVCMLLLVYCQAVTAAEVQAYRHLPVTPVESAAWLNRLNQEMWATFWQPFLLVNNLSSWHVSGWRQRAVEFYKSVCVCACLRRREHSGSPFLLVNNLSSWHVSGRQQATMDFARFVRLHAYVFGGCLGAREGGGGRRSTTFAVSM